MTANGWHCGLEQPILDWFREHAVTHTAEPSFKISRGRLSVDRGLFGFSKTRLGDDPDRLLVEFCIHLGMPPQLLEQYQQALNQIGYVGFGFECDGEEKRYKAYLDYSAQVAAATKRPISANDSEIQFLGFKWNVSGSGRPVMTEYRAFPLLPRRGMLRRGLELLGTLSPAKAVLESAFAACARDWPGRPLEYMEAREPGNPRVSFDIKFYSTSLNLSGIRAELQNLGDRLDIGAPLHDLLEANANSRLGHLAGGLDRSGTPFLMVYHGVKRNITPRPADG